VGLLSEIRKIAENPAASDIREISTPGLMAIPEIAYFINSPLNLLSGVLPPWLHAPIRAAEYVAVDKMFSKGRSGRAYQKGKQHADALARALPMINTRSRARRVSRERENA